MLPRNDKATNFVSVLSQVILTKAFKDIAIHSQTLEDILSQLSKAKVFSVLDAKDKFWKVKLDEESSYLTTFWSPCGRLRWLRMRFGINTSTRMISKKTN